MELIVKKQADIQVNYKRRENLPEQVRPKDTGLQNVGDLSLGKRQRSEDAENEMRYDYQEDIV